MQGGQEFKQKNKSEFEDFLKVAKLDYRKFRILRIPSFLYYLQKFLKLKTLI